MSLLTNEQVCQLITAAQSKFAEEYGLIAPVKKIEYRDVTVEPNAPIGESLDLIKTLPNFDGNINDYVSWKQTVINTMAYYTEGTKNYLAATLILNNKICGSAKQILSNFGTPNHFKAVLAQLDESFEDKRPLQMLQNILITLRQEKNTIEQFYCLVQETLTQISNKIKLETEDQNVLKQLLANARNTALDVFVSGLNQPLGGILFSTNPPDLPTALATAQHFLHNKNRLNFANVYAAGVNKPNHSQNIPRQKYVSPANFIPNNNPLIFRKNNPFINQYPQQQFQQIPQQMLQPQHLPKPIPMSIDNSTGRTKFNPIQTQAGPSKRNFNDSNKIPMKIQRINHIPDSLLAEKGSIDFDEDWAEFESDNELEPKPQEFFEDNNYDVNSDNFEQINDEINFLGVSPYFQS